MTAARAWSSSATVRRLDTSEHLRKTDMRGEVVPPILFRGPVAAKRHDVLSQLIADRQRVSGCHPRFLLGPIPSLHGCDGTPIATSERDHILFAHDRRIAPLTP